MANIYKNAKLSLTSSVNTALYTVPSNSRAIVKTIKLYNTHGSALDVDIKVYDASSTTDYEWDKVSVDASGSVSLLTFNNLIILEAGDKLKMQCATGNVIKMTAALLQITRPAEVTQT